MAEVTNKQHKAIIALVSTPTVTEAAIVADVAERTLWRWLGEDKFRVELAKIEGQAIDAATRKLLQLQGAALKTVEDVMNNPETPPAVKLSAARTLIDSMLRMRDLRNVEQRLSALEATVTGGSK